MNSDFKYAIIIIMKKQCCYLYTHIIMLLLLTAPGVDASGVDDAALSEGIKYVDELYDSRKATEKFREVLVSETASEELKIKACFWLAHTHLFEGEEEKAEQSIREIFEIKPDAEYDFMSVLPDSIKGNNKLMYLFNQEKGILAQKKDGEKVIEIQEIHQDEAKVQEVMKKSKFTFKKLVVSTLMAAAYVVLIVLL